MQSQEISDDHISLTEVAKIAPGRPTPSCVWRWCRKGVLARNGDRIRLRHVRVGGKIFTRRGWLKEFGTALADADARYFDRVPIAANATVQASTNTPGLPAHRQRAIEEAERDLERGAQ